MVVRFGQEEKEEKAPPVEAKVPEMWDSAGYQGVMVPSREGKSRKGG